MDLYLECSSIHKNRLYAKFDYASMVKYLSIKAICAFLVLFIFLESLSQIEYNVGIALSACVHNFTVIP